MLQNTHYGSRKRYWRCISCGELDSWRESTKALDEDVDEASKLLTDGRKYARNLRCKKAAEKIEALELLSASAATTLRKDVASCERKLSAPPSQIE